MRVLLRIVGGLLIALLAVAIGVAASVPLGGLVARGRVAELTNTTLPGGVGPDVGAYLARPPGEGPFPAVIIVHEFWGLREDIIRKADVLAQEGYVVLAPDTMRGRSTDWLPTAIFQTVRTPQGEINADVQAAFSWLSAQPPVDPARVAVMGFCFGGRAALRFSLTEPRVAATVNLYGDTETDVALLRTLPGPLLNIFGAEDAMLPQSDVQAFRRALEAAGVPFEQSVYPGVGHAFVSADDPRAAGGAQSEAWAQIVRFLDEHL